MFFNTPDKKLNSSDDKEAEASGLGHLDTTGLHLSHMTKTRQYRSRSIPPQHGSPNPSPSTSPKLPAQLGKISPRLNRFSDLSLQSFPGKNHKFHRSASLASFTTIASSVTAGSADVLFPSLDSGEDIRIRVLNYCPLEELSSANLTYQTFDADADSTGLTLDFYDRMYCMWVEHGVMTSFRLQANGNVRTNRRPSLEINGHIIGAPKMTRNRTKTDFYLSLCTGHVPELSQFRRNKDRAYNLLDYNNPGAYPEEIRYLPTDAALLKFLQTQEADITDAKMFGSLICHKKRVIKYCENTNGDPKIAYVPVAGQNNTIEKHYIQEARTLQALFDLELNGIISFVTGTNQELIFKYFEDDSYIKADLTLLNPLPASLPAATFENVERARSYIFEHKIEMHHAPIFHRNSNNVYVPLMDDAGDNGFHVCGDADSQHLGVRADTPLFAHKNFKGDVAKPAQFIIGLKLLLARLTCATAEEFKIQIHCVFDDYIDELACLQCHAHIFTEDYTKYYQNYLENDYYVYGYVPALRATLDRYLNNPALFLDAGQSSLDSLVKQFMFNHPLVVHGPEDLNPKAHPEDFGTIVICYANQIYVTENEAAYIFFLLHDPKILATQRLSVHPYWLLSNDRDPFLAKCWLDIIAIQALHETHKGENNQEKGEHFLQMYWEATLDNMTITRDPSGAARTLINNLFNALLVDLRVNHFSHEHIAYRINTYYSTYEDFTAQIEAGIAKSMAHSYYSRPTSPSVW